MKNKRTDRYEGIVSKLPPGAVTKLAAELTRRLFEDRGDGTSPSPAEMGACARAVGALAPKEREQHAKLLSRVRDMMLSATLLPPAAGAFISLFEAKVGELAALTEAKASVTAYRSLVAVRERALRGEGHRDLAEEHQQTLVALDRQLALLLERQALAEAGVSELVATDITATTLDEARSLERALGMPIAPSTLAEAAAAIHTALGIWTEIRPQLMQLNDLVNEYETDQSNL